jgi:hypothetical protein
MKTTIVWAIGIAILFGMASLGAADTSIKSFKAPASSGADNPAKAPDLREGQFDGLGTIDRIDTRAREVVIDDNLYRTVPGVTYHHDNGGRAGSDLFTVGTVVWYVLDSRDNITSLWLKGK